MIPQIDPHWAMPSRFGPQKLRTWQNSMEDLQSWLPQRDPKGVALTVRQRDVENTGLRFQIIKPILEPVGGSTHRTTINHLAAF